MLVHGDDFVLLADDGEIKAVEQLLRSKYTVNVVSVIGDGSLQQGSCHSEQDRAVRAAEQSKQDGDGNRARSTSCGHLVAGAWPGFSLQWCGHPESEEVRVARVRRTGIAPSGSRRCAVVPFWSYENLVFGTGPVRTFKRRPSASRVACKVQRRRTSVELKRAVRYLLKFPRALFVFEEQQLPKELNGWVDADFAGDLVSRRSSSGLVFLFGRHCLETSSSVQEPIGLSSGESEFDACVKGGAALLGMRSLRLDWGVCPKLTLKIRTDSSAAKGFATRRGLGHQRHVSTRFLWLQDKVSKGELQVVKVGTADQLADFLTEPVAARWLAEVSRAWFGVS